MKLFNKTDLAQRVGVSRVTVQAAAKAGWKPSHGRFSTEKSFLDWLASHPDFRVSHVYRDSEKGDSEKSAKKNRVQSHELAGKPGEP